MKQVIFITQPAYLSVHLRNLVIRQGDKATRLSFEDIGFIFLENPQITITKSVLDMCMQHEVIVSVTDEKHLPSGLVWPLNSNTLLAERYRAQREMSTPFRKQLWQTIIKAKIRNQAVCLAYFGKEFKGVESLANKVKSGDSDNMEGRAARMYWSLLYGDDFVRRREGVPPNAYLNFGYAVLRSALVRRLLTVGLFPLDSLFHAHRNNPFPLADDMMEPFRPLIDIRATEIWQNYGTDEPSKEARGELANILYEDIIWRNKTYVCMNAIEEYCTSLRKAIESRKNRLECPNLKLTFMP